MVARAFGLARRLYRFSRRRHISLQDLRDGKMDAGLLAQAALTNAVSCEPWEKSSAGVPPLCAGEDAPSQTLRMADSKFLYLWDRSRAHVSLIEKLFQLTLLLSFLEAVHGMIPAWNSHFNNANVTGLSALTATVDELLTRFALGLAVSVSLFVTAIFFEHALRHRMSRWKYFYSSLKT
jgi:hypothetical protein